MTMTELERRALLGDKDAQEECDELGMGIPALRHMPDGEPMTREQLREMDGKPVWVVCLRPQKYVSPPVGWRILEKSIVGRFGVWDGENCLTERDYGTDWLAYTYHTDHVDREAWEPCKVREDVRGTWEWFDEEYGAPGYPWDRDWGWRCSHCKNTLDDEYDDPDRPPKFKFCPNCGARMVRSE